MATKDVPGNQTPNSPEVNEKEIARLTVDQLRGRLRRRGITDTGDMKKDNLVQALVKALREGRKTTDSPKSSGTSRKSRGTGDGSRSRSGSRRGQQQRGNQTPNTAEVNEKAIARLTVDQLRGRLRRRGITDTGDMKKDNLVQALVKALREGRKTTRSRSGSTPGGRRDDAADRDVTGASEGRPDSPQEAELPEVEPRAAELESVPPQADALEDVERRAAQPETSASAAPGLPAPPANPAPDTPELPAPTAGGDARVPDVSTDQGLIDEEVTPEETVVAPGSPADAALTTARQHAGGPEDPLPRP